MGYKYYDSPEGQDCFPKMWYLTKNALKVGVVAATWDVLLYSHPKGYAQTAGRFLFYTGPLAAMAAGFAATTCVANSVRGKDDRTNYVLGGLTSGVVFGAWARNLRAGVYGSAILATAAYVKKMSVEQGWEFFPNRVAPHQSMIIDVQKHDYSRFKDL